MQWNEINAAIQQQQEEIKRGGGPRSIERQHSKGRLTARERIGKLLDHEQEFLEIGLWSAWGMYEDWGGAPSAGVVCGIGRIRGRSVMLIANDATIKAGAFFPMTCKKVLRAQRIAMTNRIPLVYLVDSAGVFLPLQDEIFPDEDDFGRIFRNNSVISAMGIPQIAAIMGNCVAGGGYLPVLCDKILMTEGSGLYLAGPALVKSAIGQEVTHEELGGAEMHAEVSGTIDFQDPDDESCLRRLADLVEALPTDMRSEKFRRKEAKPASLPGTRIYDLVSPDATGQFDVRQLIDCVADGGSFEEYKAEYGKTMVCGYARVGGFSVGIIANQHQAEMTRSEGMQFGGVIYHDSADKTARFIMDCNQTWTPLLFLQDVMGFMVGRDSEQAGIIRKGAKIVNAISNSRVPKVTIITGGSYGAGNYALCGKAFDPRFLFAWPNAKYAVMGGKQAASTLLDIQIAALKRQGQEPDSEELEELRSQVTEAYQTTTDIRYGAARGWVDGIIEPASTREVVIRCLELSTRHAIDEPFRTGVLQV
ncbi:MAG: acyl-CoA carboxylase subunit beta [Planctomycetota bacterium]|nr:acyl-CoA carboxylase subunit beta [Planctomycetota bacterium]